MHLYSNGTLFTIAVQLCPYWHAVRVLDVAAQALSTRAIAAYLPTRSVQRAGEAELSTASWWWTDRICRLFSVQADRVKGPTLKLKQGDLEVALIEHSDCLSRVLPLPQPLGFTYYSGS